MSTEKQKMFIPLLIFLVTAKKKPVRDRKLNFFSYRKDGQISVRNIYDFK